MWATVQLAQFAIAGLCAVFGCLALGLTWKRAAIAVLIALPAPIMLVSPGVAGSLYASDVIGGLALFFAPMRLDATRKRATGLFIWAALLLVVWPFVGTMVSLFLNDARDPKLIALSFGRAAAYVGTFRLGMALAADPHSARKMLTIQCCALGLVYALGLMQLPLDIDLDLWNYIRGIEAVRYTEGFGGGFMGLYRGAVGAWAVGVFAVLPIVFRGSFGLLLVPTISALMTLAVLNSGSRQGIAIGLIVLVVAACTAGGRIRLGPSIARVGLVLAALTGAFLSVQQSSRGFDRWVTHRFSFVQGKDRLARAVDDRSGLHPVILHAFVTHPRMQITGLGYGTAAAPSSGDIGANLLYVDSEALWMLQQGGVPLAAGYGVFITSVLAMLIRCRRNSVEPQCSLVRAGIVTVIAGVLLSYGHFFLLHVQSSHAPVGHWYWYVIGLSVGAATAGQVTHSVSPTLHTRPPTNPKYEDLNRYPHV